MVSKQLLPFLFIGFSLVGFSQEITVEQIWQNYEFFGNSVDGFRSMKDGNHFTKQTTTGSKQGITKHSFTDVEGSGEVLIPANVLAKIQMDDYEFNSDETKALLTTQTTDIYRHSYSAVYYLYDLKTKDLQPLDNVRQPQTLAEYSPDGTKVSYIFERNLYVKDLASGKVKQLTNYQRNDRLGV
jgi:dipeptidyl-peptidase 4